MNNRRTGFKWWVRHQLGAFCTRMSWRLLDPWDRWMIDYYNENGNRCGRVIEGFHSVARTMAKRCKGKIVGHNASEPIPFHDEPPPSLTP